MQNKEIEKDKIHLRNLSEDALKCEDNELIGIDAYAVGSITRILQYIDQLESYSASYKRIYKQYMQCKKSLKGIINKQNKEIEEAKENYKTIIQQLKTEYEQLTQSVKRYEEMRRNCKDDFYMKSYQTTIHRLNAKREKISNIIDLLEK